MFVKNIKEREKQFHNKRYVVDKRKVLSQIYTCAETSKSLFYEMFDNIKPGAHVLELGCGEGRGIDLIEKKAKSFTALDKIESVINSLKEKYPSHKFNASSFPPVTLFSDNSFDTIISFQVIEHIKDDVLFIKEIYIRLDYSSNNCIFNCCLLLASSA